MRITRERLAAAMVRHNLNNNKLSELTGVSCGTSTAGKTGKSCAKETAEKLAAMIQPIDDI